jgi:Cu(I)/Ag(I) efflux system membrane fusion protein
VTLPDDPGTAFRARVSQVPSQFNAATRTLKVRLEVDNPGAVLRPDMFVDVTLSVTLPPSISVPVDALLDSGLTQTVFVERGEGVFEPRPVEIGWRHGDRVEIVQGLAAGERIAVSGTFLLDSESRMKLAAAGATGHMHDGHIHASAPGAASMISQAAGIEGPHGGHSHEGSMPVSAPEPHSGHADGTHAHSGHQP